MKKNVLRLTVLFFAAAVCAEDIYRENAELLKSAAGYNLPEAPPTLFSWQIQDREIELFSTGSWSMALENGGLAIGFSNGTETGFQAPVFTQSVDFTLSLMMDRRWFFETSFADNFDKNTFAAGYRGRSTDIVQEFRIGNSGLFFPDIFTFVAGSASGEDTGTNTWGMSASFAHRNWKGWLLAKVENTSYEEMTFSGTNEITDSEIDAGAYIQAKWFYLPGVPANASPVSVFVETSSGTLRGSDGRSYRKLDPAEYLFSPSSGMLTLKQKTSRRVAVAASLTAAARHIEQVDRLFSEQTETAPAADITASLYQPGSGESGDPGAVSLAIDGTNATLVYVPGYFNPMAAAHMYALPGVYNGSAQSSFSVVMTETSTSVAGFGVAAVNDAFSTGTGGTYLELSAADADDGVVSRLFPLTAYSKKMYLPARDGKTAIPVSLKCRVYTEKSSISLGTDVSPSTITVYRDGMQYSAFTFDRDSGVLTLARVPADGEYIKVTFSRTTAESDSVMLNAAAGVQWKPEEKTAPWDIKGAAAVQWNISADSYADETVSYPGSILVSAETSYTAGRITAGTALAGGLYTGNSSGWYRILGMDSAEYTAYYGYNWFYPVPAAVRGGITIPGITPLSAGAMLDPVYRDTVITGALDEVTVSALSAVDRAAVIPGAARPYPATDTEVSGFVMVMEWESGSSENTDTVWTAAEIHSLTMPDYSASRKIELALKNPAAGDTYDVYLQLGIPDDDVLDAAGGTVRLSENSASIRTWRLTGSAVSDGVATAFDPAQPGWQIADIILSGEDRNALTAGTGARIIVIPHKDSDSDSDSWNSGRLAVGPMESHGSPFSNLDETASTWITPDPKAGTSNSLAMHKNAGIIERFNSTSANRVLCISVPEATATEKNICSRYFTEIDTASYDTLGFFFYTEKTPAAGDRLTVTLNRADMPTGGISVTLPLDAIGAAETWHSVTVDLRENTAAVDGTACPAAVVTGNPAVTAVSRITVAAVSGTANQQYYLDEVYLSGAAVRPRVQNKTWFTWKQNGDRIPGKQHISDAYISVVAAPDVNWQKSDTPAVSTAGSVEAGAEIFGYKISAEGALFAQDTDIQPRAGHMLSGSTGPFSVSEEYAFNLYQNTFRRNFSVGLSAEPFIPLRLKAATVQSGGATVNSTATSYSLDFTSSYISSRFAAALSETATGASLAGETYGSRWLTSWQEMIGGSKKSSKNRASKFSNATSVAAGPAEIVLDTAAGTAYTGNAAQENENTFEWKLSVPAELSKWNITPYYQRISLAKQPGSADDAWQDDIAGYIKTPPMTAGIVTLIPFYEFFDGGFTDTVESGGTYQKFTSAVGVQWSRPVFSDIGDFFIPGSADVTFGRTAVSEGAETVDLLSVSAKVAGTALNMFGTYGARNIFPFYSQDEFYRMYTVKAEFNTGYLNLDINTYHAAKFIIDKSNKIESDNTFMYSKQQSGIEFYRDNATEIKNTTWKETFSTVWTHKGKNSPVAALVSSLFSTDGGKSQADGGGTFSSPYWQAVRQSPVETLRKESLTVIAGSSSDVFYSGEIKHSVEASAAYVTVTASLALGFGKAATGTVSAAITAGLGCTIQF